MQFPSITQLSSSAATEALAAALSSAQSGAAFSLELGDGRAALLTLCGVQEKAPGTRGYGPNPRSAVSHRGLRFNSAHPALFPIITDRILSGQAKSAFQAATQLVAEGQVQGRGGTPENKAHRLSRLYRDAFKNPKNNRTNPMLPTSKDEILLSEIKTGRPKGGQMATEDRALAPGCMRRVTPRRFIIDLVKEGVPTATYDEIMSPAFWAAGQGFIQTGDTVILVRPDASTLALAVGAFDPETGGHWMTDIARSVRAAADNSEEAAT